MTYRIFFAAETYNSDAYGSGNYQEVLGSGTGTDPNTTPSTGPLANTGYDIIIPVALGLAVIGASAIMLVKKLRTSKR